MERQCLVKWDMSSSSREDAIAELLEKFSFQRTTKELLQTALETRETAQPTIVHEGIAMPHCRSILVDDFMIALGRSRRGIPWPDDIVSVIILFITPVKPTGPSEHMELIKHLAQTLRSGGAEDILAAGSPSEAASILKFIYEGKIPNE
ncbi:MAG: PTS sugar transporter subunit IIA [Candidatus Fermentibacteraceae bacterium]|nr:PTS sugar transporter subunit IIA [Candidatus Fermentibacteraceae bacterium]MBN2609687.1 PTS sugar transporter subunit IIA [Candidatus Fermentibacteraceae bacterium]